MSETSAPALAWRHRMGQLAAGALSLIAGAYASACVVRSLVTPPLPLDAPVEGPLVGLLTLYVPSSPWHVLTRATAAAASAGLLATAVGLLLASRRALHLGLWGLAPELALRMLLVPGRMALIVYPAGVRPSTPGLDRSTHEMVRQANMLVAAGFITLTMLYLLYLLWLRRELRRMGPDHAR